MKKIYLIILLALACGVGMAKKKEAVEHYYDESDVVCPVRLAEDTDGQIFTWQLSTRQWRVMAHGKVKRGSGDVVDVPLKFHKLKPGISLTCILQIKLDGEVVGQKKIVVYSRKIFKSISRRLHKLGAGAVLPESEIKKLNALGMGLQEIPLDNFADTTNEMIFCSAKDYRADIDMLSALMRRGVTLIMLAPDDKSELVLPSQGFLDISLISSENIKSKGNLGLVYNKEKIAVLCGSGQGRLIQIEYTGGKIIIVANSVYKALGKIPEAALMLKKSLAK